MRRRRPARYTLWLARTGAAPRTFSLPVWIPAALVIFLAAWSAFNLYLWNRTAEMRSLQLRLSSLSGQARQLTLRLEAEKTRNDALSQEAQEVMKSLESLEAEINRLRERAGMPRIRLTPARSSPKEPKGGAALAPEPGSLFLQARHQLTGLAGDLGELESRLDATLRREEALPRGYPLPGHTRITSYFGNRRNPFGGRRYEFHDGLDFSAPYGTPVHATAPGVVIQAGWNGPFGQSITLDHGYGYRTLYGHLSRLGARVGQRLEAGEVLGWVGSTGRSTGAHLHYTVMRYGVAVDPRAYLP
ncbi:M23 family metallopeptidase [Calidithermus chliarophilus]|uniref:M23 family metallopeptidase n=1 Tax=Calidithermus chliarophilus TaxID=52023 RepID=UPI000482ECD1|nr:M23 family metallopeptidase [Calidithermus chliarophilus]